MCVCVSVCLSGTGSTTALEFTSYPDARLWESGLGGQSGGMRGEQVQRNVSDEVALCSWQFLGYGPRSSD